MPTVYFEKHILPVTVEKGTRLLSVLQSAGVPVNAPCGGKGKCGKCAVSVCAVSDRRENAQTVPACQYTVTEDVTVFLPGEENTAILETGIAAARGQDASPAVRSVTARIPRCQIGEASSEVDRLRQVLGDSLQVPLSLAARLFPTLDALDYQANFLLCENTLLDIRPESAPFYLLAFDIGTTTLVCYLLDGTTGNQLAVASALNPQTSFGSDVISRCEYAAADSGRLTLTECIRSALQKLAQTAAEKCGVSLTDIYLAVLVGNTCMHHLYLGISPGSLLHAPYNATVSDRQCLTAAQAGLPIHPDGMVIVLPVIAGFVGADTVGVLLSLPEHTFDRLTLVIDIGTNGEMVLGRGDCLTACSTAAGPAFEGAKISCGMRGSTGAVDHVRVSESDSEFHLHIIGMEENPDIVPSGICGSGLVDLICAFLQAGILSKRGRLEKPEKWKPGWKEKYGHRFIRKDQVNAFLLTDDPDGIFLTQKDVRELQLAKAAIATGIGLLCENMHVAAEDIQSVLLAGAFGSFLSADSACSIGLIPECLRNKITVIGNAAGEGAKLAALSSAALHRGDALARNVQFLELAASKKFQDTFFGNLNF